MISCRGARICDDIRRARLPLVKRGGMKRPVLEDGSLQSCAPEGKGRCAPAACRLARG